MHNNILKSFISRFSFFKQGIDLIQQNFEINISNNNPDNVIGTITIKTPLLTKQIKFNSNGKNIGAFMQIYIKKAHLFPNYKYKTNAMNVKIRKNHFVFT